VKRPRKPPAGASADAGGRRSTGLPDHAALAAFIKAAGETDVSAIARHFGLKGGERRALRLMLKGMEQSGALGRRGRKGVATAGDLPPVGVVEVTSRDTDGDLYVSLVKGADDVAPVRLAPDRNEAAAGAPGLGDRLLVRFERLESGELEARIIKKLGQSAHRILGVIRKSRGEARVEPVDRRVKEGLMLVAGDAMEVREGDLVLATVAAPGVHRYGPKRGKLLEVIGREDDPRAFSLIAIHTHAIPMGFPPEAEAEAEAARAPTLAGREDLRSLGLVTIDPADARDHDDAVFAHPDEDPKNPGGHVVWVAIADVAAYVRPGSALDRQAWNKANSVYFPDRVEPMLPERLSAGLCSLLENEDRACMAVRMVFNADGAKLGHRFTRGLMRSAAKLSYEQAQAAIDGEPDDRTGPLLEPILRPLWAAYACMGKGRDRRSPLDIDSAERRIAFAPTGQIAAITPRARLDAHRLIEEMMIQANVCAAETLEQKRTPLLYRVHEEPSQEKLFSLADFLATLAIPWTKGEVVRTERFNRLLDEHRGGPHGEIINEVVLRSQMQAHYTSDNLGHFGLNLQRYAHFTSPIRRYADLVVHRALIRAHRLGDDGLSDAEIARLKETAEHITAAERRAMAAERDATDRYVAAFLADRIGATFTGRITGVTRFGLFVRLAETGADGLVPVSSLGGEYFIHDDHAHALVGERTGRQWRLGREVEVELREATPLTGGLLFGMLSEPEPPPANSPGPRLGARRQAASRMPPRGSAPRNPPKGVRRGKRR
jgi:ribonuclease R